jgi:hypothetical protein
VKAEQRRALFDDPDSVVEFDSSIQAMSSAIVAVADNTKVMSVFSLPVDDQLLLQAIRRALDAGILTAIHRGLGETSNECLGERYLFFVSREEAWRIPAYLSMKRAFSHGPWSDGAEFLESTLLGYSEQQTTSWIDEKGKKRVGWLGPTCYFLLPERHYIAAKKLAGRCIDPNAFGDDIEVFLSTDNLIPKKKVHELLPKGTYLCRASVEFHFFKRLFAYDIATGAKVDFFVSTITPANVNDLNTSLRSNFQFFDGTHDEVPAGRSAASMTISTA